MQPLDEIFSTLQSAVHRAIMQIPADNDGQILLPKNDLGIILLGAAAGSAEQLGVTRDEMLQVVDRVYPPEGPLSLIQ